MVVLDQFVGTKNTFFFNDNALFWNTFLALYFFSDFSL